MGTKDYYNLKGFTKKMGLAASQARFLGITLRKANCEYKSTDLAQQRLELTNQMTEISQDYANAMNATKLVWHNEAVCDSFGNPMDFGLSYGLLMMPSASNDYTPYMLTSRSGAIVLNSKYADAAEYAGISMAGGSPSAEGRRKFLASLANVESLSSDKKRSKEKNDNIITVETYNTLEPATPNASVAWHFTAGMGAMPKDKGVADITTIQDLITDSDIGQVKVDWLQIARGLKGLNISEALTAVQAEHVEKGYNANIAKAKLNYINADDITNNPTSDTLDKTVTEVTKIAETILDKRIQNYSSAKNIEDFKTYVNGLTGIDKTIGRMALLDAQIEHAQTSAEKMSFIDELENLKKGLDANGKIEGAEYDPKTGELAKDADISAKYTYPLYWSIYEKAKLNKYTGENMIGWSDGNYGDKSIDISDMFTTSGSVIGMGKFPSGTSGTSGSSGSAESSGASGSSGTSGGAVSAAAEYIESSGSSGLSGLSGSSGTSGGAISAAAEYIESSGASGSSGTNSINKLTLISNDVICTDKQEIKETTIADLLSRNLTIMTRGEDSISSIAKAGTYLMESIASVFGWGHIGTGLNIDSESDRALDLAMDMVKRKFLNENNAVKNGSNRNNSAMMSNSAYVNSGKFNRIGATENGDYAALNISNMLSAFLTYYDNYLRGNESGYIVGKGNTDGKTIFVTDDDKYAYVLNTKERMTNDEKIADFFNELYNNICEHGWRYDDMVIDNEYLESAVKDGRYQLMALNYADGYFYQQRYNDIGYMEEVKDDDAIARAEVAFTTKKAEITYKENNIDVRTKKLDAEITELNTEINSVQNIISKSIEKTFALFSN